LAGKPTSSAAQIGRGADAAWEAVASAIAGIGIGYLLDRWLGTAPWLLLGFMLLGCVAGFRRLLRLAQTANPPPSSAAADDAGSDAERDPQRDPQRDPEGREP
jgi:ATP synthase protein I